jgi:hypothetical protein
MQKKIPLNWNNLTKEEKTRYMYLQMSKPFGSRDTMLPDDCCECPACGNPTLGFGWCSNCLTEWIGLHNKLVENKAP